MIGRKVALGAATIGAFQLFVKGLDLGLTFVLARIVAPADFGLFALAVAVLLVANSVTELPVADVLVQREDLDPRLLDTAFTLTALRGLLVALALLLVSWPVATFYGDQRLKSILHVMALIPIFTGLNSPAMVHFLRRLEYGPTARSTLTGKLIGTAATILFAVLGFGYWSLIINLVATAAATMVTTHVLAPYKPRLSLQGTNFILGFAGWVTVSRIIWTLNMQGDRFLIGRIIGKSALGQYSVGSDAASMATYAIASPILQPIFSGFSRVQDDIARLRAAYLKSQQTLVMVVLPSGILLACSSDHLVPALLGPNWGQAIPVIQWLAPVIALQMMSVPVQAVAMARAQPKTLASRELFGIVLRLPATLLAAWSFGLTAAAAVRALTGLIVILFNLMVAKSLIDAPIKHQITNNWRSLASAMIMAALVIVLGQTLNAARFPALVIVISQFLVGGLTYLGFQAGFWFLAGKPDGGEKFLLSLAGIGKSRFGVDTVR